jgi:seryl-tRNA synthetase
MNGYPCAAPTRGVAEASALDRIDCSIQRIAASIGAIEMRYPSLIARAVLADAEYPKAFPHLLMSATRLDAPDAEAAGSATDWCLSPAVCYHTYAQLSHRTISEPIVMTARGRCFRAERESTTGVRQIEFDMREIVLVGSKAWIDATVEAARIAVESAARALELSGEWETAEDPFFLPAAAGKALMQRLLKVKLEYQWPRAGGVALASVNRHGTFFGERFHIAADGEPVHTACVAVGLDRWAHLAYFQDGIGVAHAREHKEAQP